jgi:hypothetical protein
LAATYQLLCRDVLRSRLGCRHIAARAYAASVLRSRQVEAFFALTFDISWLIWLVMVAGSVSIETTPGLVLNVVATAGPSIAAVILAMALGSRELERLTAGF